MDLDSCTSLKCRRTKPTEKPFQTRVHSYRGLGVCLVGHKCYVFGGYEAVMRWTVRYVFIFDIVAAAWSSVEIDRFGLAFGNVAMDFIADDKLLAYFWQPRRRRHVFSTLDLIELSEWEQVQERNAPRVRKGSSACYVESRREAIVVGVPLRPEDPPDIHLFNVDRGAWYRASAKGTPPAARIDQKACAMGNALFLVGGKVLKGAQSPYLDINMLMLYQSDFVWSTPTVHGFRPVNRIAFLLSYTRKRLFVYGGSRDSSGLYVYSILEQRWLQGNTNAKEEYEIRVDTDWSAGTMDGAGAQTAESLWVFGGSTLPFESPLLVSSGDV